MKQLLAFVLPCILVSSIDGQAPTLLKDISTRAKPTDSRPGPFWVQSDGVAVFSANHPSWGYEPWRTDGTAAGTFRIGDIWPGYRSSTPFSGAVTTDDKVFFVANHPLFGRELWVTDATFAGTKLVKDINPGTRFVHSVTSIGTDVLFFADDGGGQFQLWRSDGTENGTNLVASLASTNESVGNENTSLGGSEILFNFTDALDDHYLWRSDGTAAGTEQVSSQAFLGLRHLTPFGNKVLFQAELPGTGYEPWITDGTAAGTFALADIQPGPNGSGTEPFFPTGSNAFFVADGPQGEELYITDGTIVGTHIYADLIAGPSDSLPDIIGAFGDELIFSADDGTGDFDLFRTDVATSSVVWLSEAETPQTTSTWPGVTYGGNYIFEAVDADGRELWRSDGTPTGTFKITDIYPGPTGSTPLYLTVTAGGVVFSADEGASSRELWITDGSAAGTVLLKDINDAIETFGSSPQLQGRFQDKLFFSADDDVNGREMWITDGTSVGTSMLVDAWPGPDSSLPGPIRTTGSFAFFVADSLFGRRAWITDGTPGGTFLITGTGRAREPKGSAVLGARVFFNASNSTSGEEVWVTDGTTAGTVLFADIDPGAGDSRPSHFTVAGDKLYFWAQTPSTGTEPWVTDGTTGGTTMLQDIWPGPFSSDLLAQPWFVPVGDSVFFLAQDGTHGLELWKTDGTTAGTELVLDIDPGPGGSDGRGLIEHKGELLFLADNGFGEAIWKSDGTALGTTLTYLVPGPAISSRPELTPLNEDELVFLSGSGIWRTDGTSAGTSLAYNTNAGGTTSAFYHPGRERVIFAGDDSVFGRRLWATDGTTPGTGPFSDLRPNFSTTARLGDSIFVAADDSITGIELHQLPLTAFDDWASESIGEGCAGTGGLVPTIGMSGVARESAASPFTVDVTNARPNSPAFLLWSPFGIHAPLAGGCHLYVGSPLMLDVATTDGTGNASVAFPPIAGLAGFLGHFQYAVLDPAGSFNGAFALTGRLEVLGGL